MVLIVQFEIKRESDGWYNTIAVAFTNYKVNANVRYSAEPPH